jgi:hypothetical protein
MSIADACDKRQDFLLQKEGDCFLYQVQGQLLLSGAPFCNFIIYTKQDFYVQRIYPHMLTMRALIEKLSLFYVQHFKRFMLGSITTD